MSSTYRVEFENPTGDPVEPWQDDAHSFGHAAELAVAARCPNRSADICVVVRLLDDDSGEPLAANRFRVRAETQWIATPETT